MDSEECVPPATQYPSTTNPGRNRKRTGQGAVVMSSSVEAQVGTHHHHHDKVLRSHTRRGRCATVTAPPAPATASPPPRVTPGISRRRQRSSCCSSQTDEEEGGCGSGEYGEVSVSLLNVNSARGKVDHRHDEQSSGSDHGHKNAKRASSPSISNSNKGVVIRRAGDEQTGMIPSSSSCFTPTNETKELCEQAGLLGGTTKTTTIHSGGTRLSSSCIPPHNDLATQQCRSNNAGEHSSSNSNKSSDNTKNCSQNNIMQEVMGHNNAPRSRRRSRQHGHQHREQSTPPGDGDDDGREDDNARRCRGESGGDNNDEEMCGEDTAASCELPEKPNAAQSQTSATASALALLAHSTSVSSATVFGALTVSNATSSSLVKSERALYSASENGGKEENRRGTREKQQHSESHEETNCESVSVKREVGDLNEDPYDGTTATGTLNVNRSGGGHHDGKWSAGEAAKPGKDKHGAKDDKKVFSSPSFSSSASSVVRCAGASMPQKAGVKGSGQNDDEVGGRGSGDCSTGSEPSRPTKTGSAAPSTSATPRGSKKCAGASKKQSSVSSAQNNSSAGGGAKSVSVSTGNSAERKKSLVPAPMLLMNNLPYMGELTFDTRPRRGRKPKKADICHLISKNYGIQFPAGVTQASLSSSLPLANSKSVQVVSSAAGSGKKTSLENVTVTSVSNTTQSTRSFVPPTFCNRDVSIVPIIPTTWSSGSAAGSSSGSTPISASLTTAISKCSPATSNLLRPLSSLAQQLMFTHQNSPSSSSASSSRSMSAMVSSPQQAISMFPLSTPSSFSQSHHHIANVSRYSNNSRRNKAREDDFTGENDDEDHGMEVDIESQKGDDGDDEDNQDFPLNLCMRDSRMVSSRVNQEPLSLVKEDSLDVRWSRSGGGGVGGGGGGGASNKGAVRSCNMTLSGNSYSPDGAKESGSNKRSMAQSSSTNPVMKGGKSAKLGNTSRTSSSLNFSLASSYSSNSVCDSDNVSTLVSSRPSPSPSSAASPYGNLPPTSKLSPNIFAISAHHLQQDSTCKAGNGGKGKQSGQSRKKKDINLRGDVSISATGSPGSQGGTTPSSSSTGLSSMGGTLFGQSTAGINDGAEVSICKFKFTGGAKPCLQEKKMLSVDSGGNFRFYSDKTSGTGTSTNMNTGKLAGKGPQQQGPLSGSSGPSNSLYSGGGRADHSPPSGGGDGFECHYALSSLPKSAKSMSMCMPMGTMSNSGIQIQLGSSKGSPAANKLTLPLIPSSSSTSSYGTLPISPTTEELQQLHLSMQEQAHPSRSSSRVSPYPSGEYSYSSSNSCSSSDNGFGGDTPSSSSAKSNQKASGSGHHFPGGSERNSSKMKLKRKRRTRKSLMREKLEKTFKEKGFLIQTQQLESAEGATYCKFRQLRKFTRYLFRSWKDYLPDHVKEISDNNANSTNNGNQPGAEQGMPSNLSNSEAQLRDGSIVQSIDDDEDDGDEEDEVDSEEQPRQSLISQGSENPDESDDNMEEDGERQVYKRRRNRKGKYTSSTQSSAKVEKKEIRSTGQVDTESSNKDDDSEELEVDA